ncbi:MAG: primosomal protein N' [Spirochaetaceae bacterium]|jgi:primosomal protein N' (replication factor Y)|nr:primosomal protein N' [Spirochaetaceae bacterium]
MPHYFELLFDTPVKQRFTYRADEKGEAAVGRRAMAPFGRREAVGCIVAERETPPAGLDADKIKAIRRVVDKAPLFGEDEIALACWVAAYYLCSEGEALFAMLPSGRRAAVIPTLGGDALDSAEERPLTLSQEQEDALHEIVQQAGWGMRREGAETENKPPLHFYLYGITGSGKTEVFLRAAEQALAAGKSVIYLVPEISLTHQAAEVVTRRFANTAAMIHSAMSGSERLREWTRIRQGEARIVVGPRSAIFAPVKELGLVIIDEEHDGSFKSGNTPRYHARQVAMRRVAMTGAALLMGSATPSAEAWKLMAEGRIHRLNLTARLSGGAAPLVKPVSLEHTSSCLTLELQEEIRQTALAGRQTILFLNRRGFAYFYHCKDCGYELCCKRCSVSLTWHKARGRAVCHYCGYETRPPESCPSCGSLEAGFMGIGTEMVEEEVKRRFPELRLRRLDADTIEKKGGLEETLTLFKAGAIDILLGTQMVAKGLNFPGVRLVGVIFADTGLHLPDFRAAERTFSLIVQVAGRAGRFFPDGKVLVQTLRPNDGVIQAACALDVEGFFRAEFENRRMQGFPPYSRLIRVVARGRESDRVASALGRFFVLVRPLLPRGADILGPAECPLSLIAGNFRRQILLRGTDMAELHRAVRIALEKYENSKDARVYIEVDVDPAQLL